MKNYLRMAYAMVCFSVCINSVGQPKQIELSTGWELYRNDMGHVWEVVRPVPAPGKPEEVPLWTPVELPHCYNATDAVNPDIPYYEGVCWYRTQLDIANPFSEGHTILEFEGSGQKTEVYVYTQLVATHVGGYDRWNVDITEAVEKFRTLPVCQSQFQGRIPLSVRCDNTRDREMIPSDMSDFNLYGGIYRPLYLVYQPKTYVPDLQVDAQSDGSVDINFKTIGNADQQWVEVFDPQGKLIAKNNMPVEHLSVKKPLLWDVDAPNLYSCRVSTVAGGDTAVISRTFGFRSFEFVEKGPFRLNGRRLLLKGTHRHEDHAGVAAAMSYQDIRREMIQIKNMGANFIRLGHYQQDERTLALCDSLGILVWEEIPWCRGGLGGERYRAQAKRMLTNMIDQHRHHPSIILWGMGNENDWPGDFDYFEKDSIRAFMRELHNLSHQLDPSRLTTIRRCDFCNDIVDVYSPSIWAGWYSRKFTDYAEMERKGFESVPRFFHAEWGGDSHYGRHAEDRFDIAQADKNGDWSESYIVRLFDWHLKEQAKMPWLTGTAFWTFKDFSTPLRPRNPIPYVNQKGVVCRDGSPKESYYVFQSYWATEPMVHIYGHNWPVRWGDEGQTRQVFVYSNCDEVELVVNGVSLGTKQRNIDDYPAQGFHWDVAYKAGDNEIVAIAKTKKKNAKGKTEKVVLEDTIVQKYETRKWGTPAGFEYVWKDIDSDLQQLDVTLVDKNGVPCLDASCFVRFESTDAKSMIVDQGTPTGSSFIQLANGHASIRFRRNSKPLAVSVTAELPEEIVTLIQR